MANSTEALAQAKGFLYFDFSRERLRDEDHLSAIQMAAHSLSSAMRRHAVQEARLAEREAQLYDLQRTQIALQQTIDTIQDIDNIDQIIQRVLKIVANTLNSEVCAVFSNEPSGLVKLKYWYFGGEVLSPLQLLNSDQFDIGSKELFQTLIQGFTVPDSYLGKKPSQAIGVFYLDHRLGTAVPEFDQFAVSNGWDLELNIGVGSQSVRRASLCLYRSAGFPFTKSEQALADSLAKQVGLALEVSSAHNYLLDIEVRAAIESERVRLARDIHDSLAQNFGSIAMQSDALLAYLPKDERICRSLNRIMDTARAGMAEARATALALMPVANEVGAIDESLKNLAERSTVQDRFQCTFHLDGIPYLLPVTVQDVLLRIAQEGINNAIRHSGGNRVALILSYSSTVMRLMILDNGTGLDDHKRIGSGMGLKGMTDRTEKLGGSLLIKNAIDGGLEISVIIPISAQ